MEAVPTHPREAVLGCGDQGLTLPVTPGSSFLLQAVPETAGIKFPDFKSAGVTLRSQRVCESSPSLGARLSAP